MPDNPFELIQRVLVASVKIVMYSIVFTIQAVCYAIMLKRDRIVDAFGYLGRGIADAFSEIFRK